MKQLLKLACFLLVVLSRLPVGAADTLPPVRPEILKPRQGLANVLQKLTRGEEVCVGYFGGSITEWSGWRERSFKWFQTNYPMAKLSQVNAAMGGTGSALGVYRIEGQLLAKNPDLIFVEFGVNDREQTAASLERSMEGIVRKIWKHNPATDICFVYTLCLEALPDYNEGRCPGSVAVHEQVADYYGIPSINVGYRIVQMLKAGKVVFNAPKDAAGKAQPLADGQILFSHDTCHPTMEGHQIYSEVIAASMRDLEGGASKAGNHPLPAPQVADNWEHARMVAPAPAMLSPGWKRTADSRGPGQWMRKYMPDIWETDQPGEKLTFTFQGTSVQLYYVEPVPKAAVL